MVKSADIPDELRDLFDVTTPRRQRNAKVTSVRKGTVTKMQRTRTVDKFVLDNGLTPEQEAYARARAFGMTQQEAIYFATNGRVASVGAGSSMETQYPLVKKRINDLSVEVADRVVEAAAVSKGWVLTMLRNVAERCMQAVPVMEFNHELKQMVETGEYRFDSAGANRSLELIGKELGMFVDRKHFTTGTERLSEAELDRAISDLSAEVKALEGPSST